MNTVFHPSKGYVEKLKFNSKNLIFFFIILGLIYFFTLNSNLTLEGDDSNYLILARSIINGQGYTNIHSPIPTPNKKYPPFFPLLLCPLILIFGENIFILKLIPLISMLSAVYVLFLLFKDYKEKNYFLLILLFALNPLTLYFATTLISESPYFLFSFLTLYLISKYSENVPLLNKYLWLTLIMMLISFYTRTTGIVLLPVAFFFLILKNNSKKAILISILYLTGIFPWIFRGILIGSNYIGYFLRKDITQIDSGMVTIGDLLSRIVYNSIIYGGKVLVDLFFFPHFYNISKVHQLFIFKVVLSLVLLVLILYGYIKRIKKEIKPIDFYVIFVSLICISWPIQEPRFISPIFPFLLLFLFSGIEAITNKRKYAIIVLAIIIFLPGLIGDFQLINKARSNFYTPEERSYLDALEWIKHNSSKESKVMCRKPRAAFVITERRAAYYPFTYDTEKVIKAIEMNDINYVILDALGKKYARFGTWSADKFLSPAIQKFPERFALMYKSSAPDTYVYKVVKID